MPQSTKYICSCCSKEQEQWPALAYDSPTNYNNLSAADKQSLGKLSGDFCTINHSDQTDRFVRCTLTQKVDSCDSLEYGLWVSLSEKSFNDYSKNYNNPNHETQYFGWLSNDLPDYDFSEGSIPTTVITKLENARPEIFPNEGFDHPFVKDYYGGITKEEAERRVNKMLVIVI